MSPVALVHTTSVPLLRVSPPFDAGILRTARFGGSSLLSFVAGLSRSVSMMPLVLWLVSRPGPSRSRLMVRMKVSTDGLEAGRQRRMHEGSELRRLRSRACAKTRQAYNVPGLDSVGSCSWLKLSLFDSSSKTVGGIWREDSRVHCGEERDIVVLSSLSSQNGVNCRDAGRDPRRDPS